MPRPLRSSFFLSHFFLPLALTAPLLGGCSDDPAPAGPPPDDTPVDLFLTNDHNYTSVATLDIPFVETEPQADLEIDWSAIMENLQCHDVSPEDISNVSFARFDDRTEADVAEMLTQGELDTSEADQYADFQPDGTTNTMLSTLALLGKPPDLSVMTDDRSRTFLMLFAKGSTVPGVGVQTMTFLRPTDGSSNTRVDAPVGCGMLDFTADIASQEAGELAADGPFVVDWSGVTVDALGNPFLYASVSSLLVGFYEDMTVQDLEDGFFDLETMVTSMYELPIAGKRKADLADAVERTTDENFAGFDRTNGTWMMALLCESCQNPQPLLLTVLEPN